MSTAQGMFLQEKRAEQMSSCMEGAAWFINAAHRISPDLILNDGSADYSQRSTARPDSKFKAKFSVQKNCKALCLSPPNRLSCTILLV